MTQTLNSNTHRSQPTTPPLYIMVKEGVALTPMFQQYYEIKKANPDTLLLFRMGDFYELFFEDAKKAAHLLGITLTHRGKLGPYPVPMAGIPHHAANTYIDKLTEKGLRVSICEQLEDPKSTKGLVKRGVVQTVGPGLPYDLDRLEGKEKFFIGASHYAKGWYFSAFVDFTSGEFDGLITQNPRETIKKWKLYDPKEILSHMGQWEDPEHQLIKSFLETSKIPLTHLTLEHFNEKFSRSFISKLIPSYERDEVISQNKNILSPLSALSYYICSTQMVNDIYHLRPFRIKKDQDTVGISLETLKGLNILPQKGHPYKESLLGHMDHTQTAMGSRFLKEAFLHASRSLDKITYRQKMIQYLLDQPQKLEALRSTLKPIKDLERILAKASLKKTSAQDLLGLKEAIGTMGRIERELRPKEATSSPHLFTEFEELKDFEKMELSKLAMSIDKRINAELGASLEKGDLIKRGVDKKRDQYHAMTQNGHEALKNLEAKLKAETNIPVLKIKHNNIFGHFIEVTKTHLKKVPSHFQRKQTLVNSERFVTTELLSFEKDLATAKDLLLKADRKIFEELVELLKKSSPLILKMIKLINHLDLYQCFAWAALHEDLTCPIVRSDKKILKVQNAFHPLIKTLQKSEFTPHNLCLNDQSYFALITGPNMAGKTTVMREMAIIQFLGQLGSFVPAEAAEIGLCDYMFSRLGAHDDILKGHSTFMVEMSETAEILRHATDRSLIILDEVGRGTSTYDGLAIAWALTEYFVKQTKAITLFASHYHELIELADKLIGAKNLSMAIEHEGLEVRFLYQLIEKGADQSFGLYVAKLAGLPHHLIERAQVLLNDFESSPEKNVVDENQIKEEFNSVEILPPDEENLPLIVETSPLDKADALREELKQIDLLTLTPLDAFNKVRELKEFYL